MADRTVLLVPRVRRWLPLAALLLAAVLVVVGGTAVAKGLAAGGSQDAQYRTALVASGTVRQTLSLSGTAARVGQVTVGWPMSGTVATVDVSVGQHVSQGQQLATMDTAPLQQAVLDAQAQVDQARVTLDNDETSATSQSSTSSATTRSSSGSGGPAATTGSSRTGSSGTGAGDAPIDTNALTAASGKVDQAQQAAASACAPLLATQSGTGKQVAATSPHASSTSPSSTTDPSSTSDPTTSESKPTSSTSSPSTTTSPSATAPSADQVTACLAALQAVSSAQAKAGSTIDSLAAQLAKAAAALAASNAASSAGGGSSSSGAAASGSASGQAGGSGAATSSEAKHILDQAALTSSEAALTKANDELAAATLTAPVSGVVGSLSLAVGSSTAANTGIVIVTPSAAQLTIQVPQANLASVAVGQAATVTPAGGGSLSGSVSSIGLLPTSSSTGSSATTYAVVVDVPQATEALATGAKASLTIETSRVDNVLTVPVSAVTSVATGTGSVGVLRDGSVSQTTVRTGSVGQGKVAILSGLSAGQTVVLADTSQALPSNSSGLGARVGAGAGAGGLTGGAGGGLTGQGGAPPGAPPGR